MSMSDPTTANVQIVDSINVLRSAVLTPQIIKATGAGKAYHSIAQSAAIAVQDATDNLRNMTTIGATAVGVAMSQYIETGSKEHKDAITQAQNLVTQAVSDFQKIGEAAAIVVSSFSPNFGDAG